MKSFIAVLVMGVIASVHAQADQCAAEVALVPDCAVSSDTMPSTSEAILLILKSSELAFKMPLNQLDVYRVT